jgi:hypothetical protein
MPLIQKSFTSARRQSKPSQTAKTPTFFEGAPHAVLRGLIHSDGCRFIATERKGAYVRRAPRYAFTNRSEDILQLFGTACDAVGVHFTRASPTQIAVYSKDSVAILDRFIGPKR